MGHNALGVVGGRRMCFSLFIDYSFTLVYKLFRGSIIRNMLSFS